MLAASQVADRPELGRLFWVRDGERRAFSLLQSALLAAHVCRQVPIPRR